MSRHIQHHQTDIVNDVRATVGNFQLNPHLQLGDADSAHQVMFGQIDPFGHVAVKPFTKEGKARRESKLIEEISIRGFDTLEPLMVATGGLGAYLITSRQPDLRHLGQMDWAANIASPRLNTDLVPALYTAGDHIGRMHGRKIVHGDYQVKNAAVNNQGKPVVVDVERAQINQSEGLFEAGADNDHTLFGLSVMARGLLADRSPSFRAGFLADKFLSPSFDAEQSSGQEVDRAARIATIQARWVALIKVGRIPIWLQKQMDTTPVRNRPANNSRATLKV